MLRMLCLLVPPLALTLVFAAAPPPAGSRAPDAADWATYNYDLLGSRHNRAEKALGRANVTGLVEKWRFPSASALRFIGAIHATPVVVNGHTYIVTATSPTLYKGGPDGQQKWYFQPPASGKQSTSYGVPTSGFFSSPLVTADTVYVADVGGFLYAVGRFDGKERWKVNTRARPFPGAHTSNCFFASPVLADGKLIVAGGGFEHGLAANPKEPCCTGRGCVAALDRRSGDVLWKYDVGPKPEKLDPPVKLKNDWGGREYQYGPSTSSVWSTPSYDAETGLVYFGTDAHNAPRQPTKDDPKLYTKHSCAVIAVDVKTGAERWVTQINPGDIWSYSIRVYDSKT